MFTYPSRIYSAVGIPKITSREVITMKSRIRKKLVSILIESPVYFTLPVKARYFLLSRLVEQLRSVLKEYDDKEGMRERSRKTDIT